jgi:hypothetical protein
MKRLLVTALAAVMATAGVATVAEAHRRDGMNDTGRIQRDRGGETSVEDGYYRYGYYGYRGNRYYASGYRDGCYRLKVNRWGEVRYKLRRACRW